jgi:hypothetical protein
MIDRKPTNEEASLQKAMFERYAKIHKAIMDPSDTSVKKQYITLQSSGSGK